MSVHNRADDGLGAFLVKEAEKGALAPYYRFISQACAATATALVQHDPTQLVAELQSFRAELADAVPGRDTSRFSDAVEHVLQNHVVGELSPSELRNRLDAVVIRFA